MSRATREINGGPLSVAAKKSTSSAVEKSQRCGYGMA
jgi:hypothetical protein